MLALAALCLATGIAPAEAGELSIHGFFTQAWARANFVDGTTTPTSREVALGIPEDGTTDYRIGALQFAYEMSEKSRMIVQLSTRAVGSSPVEQVEDEVELDWAFYEYRPNNTTRFRIGRIQIPFGIYNEIRDVGTLLPFYRPPYEVYGAGTYTSETVDGVLAAHELFTGSDWSLEIAGYYGEHEVIETRVFERPPTAVLGTASDVFGAQLWLETPVEGLRFGLAGTVFALNDGSPDLRGAGEEQDADQWLGSLDLDRERWFVRAEFKLFHYGMTSVFPGADIDSGYVQLGWRATEKLQIVGRAGWSETRFDSDLDIDYDERAYGLAVNYSFHPTVVLKAEHHFDIELESLELAFVPGMPTPVITRVTGTDGDYSIVSLSVSF
ncbi:MAG: hypothetical protein AAGD38_08360 [Acidobacteriota bacterium]